MAKAKRRKATVYLSRYPLHVLGFSPSTENVNGALVALANLIADRTMRYGRWLTPQDWRFVADALEGCIDDVPQPGESWVDLVMAGFSVALSIPYCVERAYGVGSEDARQRVARIEDDLDDLGALSLVTAARFYHNLPSEGWSESDRWWEIPYRQRFYRAVERAREGN